MKPTTTNTLYERVVKNDKVSYRPVKEFFCSNYFRPGQYLVTIAPGRQSLVSYFWRPERAATEAVLQLLREGMSSAMVRRAAPQTDGSTAERRDANKAAVDAALKVLHKHGGDTVMYGACVNDVIEAGLAYIRAYCDYLDKFDKIKMERCYD